jgi:hypothetical protein
VGISLAVSILNETTAVEDFLDLGTYPIFLARDTTFSRRVAESKNTSLTDKFELNALI